MTRHDHRHVGGRWAVGLAAVTCVLAVAGCSGAHDAVVYADPTASPTPTKIISPTPTKPPAVPLPLTGRPASSAAAAAAPAVAVPVLAGSGRPAARGLSSADAVWVTLPSSSSARALAIFQSVAASRVGPVASTRPSDGKLLPVTDAGIAYAGGPPGFVKQLDALKIPQLTSVVAPERFHRNGDGTLDVSVATARTMSGIGHPRSGVFAYDAAVKPAAKARTVTVRVPGRSPFTLTWSPSTSRWTGSLSGLPVSAHNVVVQTVPYASVGIPYTHGQTEMNPTVFGTGSAVMMPAGAVVPGHWNRTGRKATTGYTDSKNNAVPFSPGSTWVLLVPGGTTVR